MSQKYTDARYPEKINNLIDNEGGLSEEGKSTINESVKEAIEGGDIPIPAGGTKLYLHHFTGFTVYQGCDLYIISWVKEPCISEQDLSNLATFRISALIKGGGVPNYMYVESVKISTYYHTISLGSLAPENGTHLICCKDTQEGEIEPIVGGLVESPYACETPLAAFTDTVTEL